MVEKIVKDYLQSSLGIPVRLEEEDDLGNEYVLIEKTGSGDRKSYCISNSCYPVLFRISLRGGNSQ